MPANFHHTLRDQLQSHFNVLSTTLDTLTTTLHQHFPAHSNSALTTYPLPSFPAQTQEILLTTLLSKKPPPETIDAVWAALRRGDAEDQEQEELWSKAAEIVAGLQEERNWWDELVTAEEREQGLDEDALLGNVGREVVEEKKEGAGGGEALVGILRFWNSGVEVGEQVPLPKKR